MNDPIEKGKTHMAWDLEVFRLVHPGLRDSRGVVHFTHGLPTIIRLPVVSENAGDLSVCSHSLVADRNIK